MEAFVILRRDGRAPRVISRKRAAFSATEGDRVPDESLDP